MIGVAALCTIAAAVAAPQGASAAPSSTVTEWTAVPQCAAPRPGHASCHALRLVPHQVKAGATGGADRTQRAATNVPNLVTGPSGGYTPGDLATAYGVNAASTTANGQIVAIVDAFADPNVLAELNTFNTQYGLPAETSTSFKVVNQAGASSPLPAANSKWAGEIALDVQTVRGLCHVCKIVLVEGNSAGFDDLATAVNTAATTMHATEISNSYGGFESSAAFTTADRAKYNHQNVVITASTGDDGWYGWDHINVGHNGTPDGVAEVPSALSTVVAVGGTSLYLNSDATRADEQVWNSNGPHDYYGWSLSSNLGASGGGCSQLFNGAGWQTHLSGYPSLGCGSSLRSGTDIAAVADPFTGYDVYRSYGVTAHWYTYGGTSLAAPVVAALWALGGGPHGYKYPALSLYGHYKSDTTRPFYDVTVGGNGACGTSTLGSCSAFFGGNPNLFGLGRIDCGWDSANSSPVANRGQCYAGAGYDGPSGVGTPNGTTPFQPLWPTFAITKPTSVVHGHSAAFSASSEKDPFPGGAINQWTWKWGDGTTTTPTSASTSHTYAAAGTYTVTLTVTDNYSRTASHSAKVVVT
jgi:subtilase family serine protease